MNEHKAIDRIHSKTRQSDVIDYSKVRCWKIRDDFQAGVPDAFYCPRHEGQGRTLWIEYKYIRSLPVRESTRVIPKWNSEQQRLWLNDLHSAGQPTLCVVAFGEGRTAGALLLTYEEWNNGISTAKARAKAVPLNDVAAFITGFVIGEIPADVIEAVSHCESRNLAR